jgi:hypothetical protein
MAFFIRMLRARMPRTRTMAIDIDGWAALDKPTRVRVDVRATMVVESNGSGRVTYRRSLRG